MTKLKLADDLALPADEAITQKYGFIGRSGSGKSYAAMRLAELFLEHDGQIIALDWVGIWWSLRLAKNGKDAGFKHVYIFGGEHADLELRPESGTLMADLAEKLGIQPHNLPYLTKPLIESKRIVVIGATNNRTFHLPGKPAKEAP